MLICPMPGYPFGMDSMDASSISVYAPAVNALHA